MGVNIDPGTTSGQIGERTRGNVSFRAAFRVDDARRLRTRLHSRPEELHLLFQCHGLKSTRSVHSQHWRRKMPADFRMKFSDLTRRALQDFLSRQERTAQVVRDRAPLAAVGTGGFVALIVTKN